MQSHFGRALCHTGTPRGNIDTAQLQAAGYLLKSFTFLAADQVVCRNAKILENQLCTVDGAVTQFFKLLAYAEAVAFFTYEQAHAAMWWRRTGIGFGEYGETIAFDTVGDPGFGTV